MAHNLTDKVHVRLPTDAELQMYFGGDDEDEENGANDDDEDSNAENYYLNEYPDEDEFGRDDDALENDTTSDESFCSADESGQLNF